MSDEEPLFRPWMEDARIWQVAICDLFHSAPWQSMLLTSSSDGAEPTIDYVMPKRCDRRRTHWHRVIREPATQDLAEPYALSLYAIMASCSKMFLYLPQLRSHPFAHRCPSKHETAAASPGRAVMRESEKIERLRLPKASSLTACYCMPSELDEPRLIGMKTEPKLRKASREVREEPLRVLRMLEADDRIVRIADDAVQRALIFWCFGAHSRSNFSETPPILHGECFLCQPCLVVFVSSVTFGERKAIVEADE